MQFLGVAKRNDGPARDRDAWKSFAVGGTLSLLIFAAVYRQTAHPAPRPGMYAPSPTEADKQSQTVQRLSAREVAMLEAAVAKNPDDLESRAKLLAYYSGGNFQREVRRHMLWMIRHHPEGIVVWGKRFTPMVDASLDPEGYAEGRKLWLSRLTRHHIPVQELENASNYFKYTDAIVSLKLAQRAAVADSDAAELGVEYYEHLTDGPVWQWFKPFSNSPGQPEIRIVTANPKRS